MLFNSIEFLIFLPLVFFIYWFLFPKNLKLQNLWILIASYVFYGWWDYRFLSLIFFSSLVDFLIGIQLNKRQKINQRKFLLFISLAVNLGFLGFFKYYNFFAESFADAFTLLGNTMDPSRLNIILPVGISFYTFQTMSYTIDVYRKKMAPVSEPIAFFAYVSFFPQLVAGPIERATNLLPQFFKNRDFNYTKACDGLRQILWGLFKKIVIADNCAIYVNDIFNDYQSFSGFTLLLGGVLFAFQIYGDFSGYSDIAIGTSRLFGFDLKRILLSLISPATLLNSGEGGTSPFLLGLGIIYTYLLEEAGTVMLLEISLLYLLSVVFGMEPIGHFFFGVY